MCYDLSCVLMLALVLLLAREPPLPSIQSDSITTAHACKSVYNLSSKLHPDY